MRVCSAWVVRCSLVVSFLVPQCVWYARADPPAPAPRPILPPLAPGQVLRIGPTAGTGTPTGDYGIGATDLCEFVEFPSQLLQVCGDSFAGQGVGFGGWYAPVALHVDTESIDDPAGVRYTGVTGVGTPLLADPTPPGDSQLPAGVVQINRRNYLMVTTTKAAPVHGTFVTATLYGGCRPSDIQKMTETPQPAAPPPSAATTSPPPSPQQEKPPRLYRAAAWVVIVAGIVFTVAVIFFSGALVLGQGKCPYHRYYHHGMFRPVGPVAPGPGMGWVFGFPGGPPPPGMGPGFPGGPGGPAVGPTGPGPTTAPARP